MEVREDDEEFQNPVDLMFEALEKKKPNHFAVRQYKKYKLAAGVVCSKRLLNQAVGKSLRTHNLKPKKGAQVMRKNEKITALYERLSRDDFGKDDERDRKGSIQTTQEVEIYFNFVGRFVPPAFGEVELTPEELEEIRKREERKDRLHQNYLKRKASGAQKRYEDKIKGRKKAEIEAKKAAIRAEDIAKGVFVPVSSLPQREPMKGVQTA